MGRRASTLLVVCKHRPDARVVAALRRILRKSHGNVCCSAFGVEPNFSGRCSVTIFLTDLDGTVTQHDGNFLAVDGFPFFDGIFTAVTQHDGNLPAADGFRFLGAFSSKWPYAKHISST